MANDEIPIECKVDNYANFLSSLVFLLMFGFAWGHISHSSRKLFRILNKMYAYIVLPALAIFSPIAIQYANNGWAKNRENPEAASWIVWRVLLVDLVTKSTLWLSIVAGFLIVFRTRTVLKTAAITAQFVVHGNDIGFSKRLLEATCKITSENGTHVDDIDFMSIEAPTNAMCFLIFLPLTHGLVGMTEQNRPTLKGFLHNLAKQMGKFGLSYACLAIGIAVACTSKLSDSITRLSSFQATIHMAQTLQTLMVGIYIYYLLMNCNWGHLSIWKSLALTAAVTFVYPIFYHIIYTYCWTQNGQPGLDEIIILGHASTPASIYAQVYILKHVRCPTNYLIAFLLTTVLGALLMYIFVIDQQVFEELYDKFNISPVDYYVTNHQWEFMLTSAVFLIIFGVLIYARLHYNSDLRRLIFITIMMELIADIVMLAGGLFDQKTLHESVFIAMFLSAISMVDHIGATALIALLFLYKSFLFVRRKWKVLIPLIIMTALAIPMAIYGGTYLIFKKRTEGDNPELQYNYKSIYFFLDLRLEGDESDVNIRYPIGVIAYTITNVIALLVYASLLLVVYFKRRRAIAEDNEDLIENVVEPEDQEKYLACAAMFGYQFVILILSISFGIRNINYSKEMKTSRWADYTLEFFELFSLVLCDLAGAYITLIFCISPGKMETEVNRFLYIPRKIRTFLTRCTEDEDYDLTDITNLPLGDLDRCRRFILYHKQAFIAHFPPTVVDDRDTFKGRDLVAFLVQTGVADSPGEAVNFGDSYLRGRAIAAEEHGILLETWHFIGDNTVYCLTPENQIPDFNELMHHTSVEERPFFYLDYD